MSKQSAKPAKYETAPGTDVVEDWFVPIVPTTVLLRHDARVLDPTKVELAPPIDGAAPLSPPAPTVYSRRALLIPEDLVRLRSDAINEALSEIGLALAAEPDSCTIGARHRDDDRDDDKVTYHRAEPAPEQTPQRPVGLRIRPGGGSVDVDAWRALQTLRAATARNSGLTAAEVGRIGLDHLLFGSALYPTLGGVPGGPLDPSPPKGSTLDSYIRSARGGPVPVRFLMDPPPRDKVDRQSPLGRRPVVAVLDTGTAEHPWFPPAATEDDPFLVTAPEAQQVIAAERTKAVAAGAVPARAPVIADGRDAPMQLRPLIGDVSSHYGHFTFIAGILRQLAPRATVLAIRVMYPDGVVRESDLIVALRWLRDRVRTARTCNRPQDMVDIVSLSMGYYDELYGDSALNSDLAGVLGELTAMGVLVVAAAGNDATGRQFLPAAMASSDEMVTSVGACNPNGTHAMFSNEAGWVTHWEAGAAIVSTFPTDANGGGEPQVRSGQNREDFDGDDYTCGFALWHGTSFAAPVAAARLANCLIKNGGPGHTFPNPKGCLSTLLRLFALFGLFGPAGRRQRRVPGPPDISQKATMARAEAALAIL